MKIYINLMDIIDMGLALILAAIAGVIYLAGKHSKKKKGGKK